jgi:DNA-directed RNA polymerase specialized sigma24 family protein
VKSAGPNRRRLKTQRCDGQSLAMGPADRRGDQEAFAQLYDRVVGQVFGVVRRVVRDPAQSEEVAQEVLSRCGGQRRASIPVGGVQLRG